MGLVGDAVGVGDGGAVPPATVGAIVGFGVGLVGAGEGYFVGGKVGAIVGSAGVADAAGVGGMVVGVALVLLGVGATLGAPGAGVTAEQPDAYVAQLYVLEVTLLTSLYAQEHDMSLVYASALAA